MSFDEPPGESPLRSERLAGNDVGNDVPRRR